MVSYPVPVVRRDRCSQTFTQFWSDFSIHTFQLLLRWVLMHISGVKWSLISCSHNFAQPYFWSQYNNPLTPMPYTTVVSQNMPFYCLAVFTSIFCPIAVIILKTLPCYFWFRWAFPNLRWVNISMPCVLDSFFSLYIKICSSFSLPHLISLLNSASSNSTPMVGLASLLY